MELGSGTKIYIHMPAIFSAFKNSPDTVFQALRNTNNASGIKIIIHIINKHFLSNVLSKCLIKFKK